MSHVEIVSVRDGDVEVRVDLIGLAHLAAQMQWGLPNRTTVTIRMMAEDFADVIRHDKETVGEQQACREQNIRHVLAKREGE